jgi:hypothetical protein
MEQLVILIIIGLISLVNWIMQKAAEKRAAAKLEQAEQGEEKGNIYTQGPSRPAVEEAPAAPASDSFKDLMDALGLPSEVSAPPEPVARRLEEPSFLQVEDLSLPEPPPPLPSSAEGGARPFDWQASTPSEDPDEKTLRLASSFSQHNKEESPTWTGGNLRHLLGSRQAQRQAVVLAEILGTPRGLEPSGAPLWRN